jgi:hypothetical protein
MIPMLPDTARGVFELAPAGAAERLYSVSRDLYSPVLAAFAARCLDTLARQPRAVNLCLARDGISAFVAQRVLLRLVPARFRRISPRRVRLVYLSRQLMSAALNDPETFHLVNRYLQQSGLCRGACVTLVDVGIHGHLQDVLTTCYPECTVRGEYLIYRRRLTDANAAFKRGLLAGDPRTADTACFLRRDTIHLLEDLWSGVYESVEALRAEPPRRHARSSRRAGRVRPRLDPLGERSIVLLPSADLRRLKRAALHGVVDGVTQLAQARATIAGLDDAQWLVDRVRRLGEWVESSRAPHSPDAWLWHTVIRPDHGEGDQ